MLQRQYFAASSVEKDAIQDTERCDNCDNCSRADDSTELLDVTLDSWKILKTMEDVSQQGGRLTIAGLSDLARGLGGGTFAVSSGGGKARNRNAEGHVDLDAICGGKSSLNGNVSSFVT